MREPARLPQRWALIFTVATGVGVAVTVVTGNLAAGIGAASAIVALLHKVMD